MPAPDHPPLYTALSETIAWTLLRTADIPKSHRFSFGQRIDNLSLDALMLCIRAIYAARAKKAPFLEELNLTLEQLRALWRMVHGQRWISQQQLIFIISKIDEAGRMTGGWLKQVAK